MAASLAIVTLIVASAKWAFCDSRAEELSFHFERNPASQARTLKYH